MRSPSRPRADLAVLLVAALAGGCGGAPTATPTPAPTAAPTAAPTPRPTPNLPPIVDIVTAGAAAFTIGPAPDFIVLVDGVAFVNAAGGGIGNVARIDESGTIVADHDIPGGSCGALDVGYGAVWTATCPGPGLARIDIATAAVTPIEAGLGTSSEMNIGVGEEAVWLTIDGVPRTLVKIDAATNAVLASYPLDGVPNGARVAFGSVWIPEASKNLVYRFDPREGKVVAAIQLGSRPSFITVGEGAVWVMHQLEGGVSRIDPASNTVAATIDVGEPINGGDIATGGGFVWLRGSETLLWKIDPGTNSVVAVYGPASGSGSVAADEAAVWVTAHDVQMVWRLPLD